jgi:hypothetical protein
MRRKQWSFGCLWLGLVLLAACAAGRKAGPDPVREIEILQSADNSAAVVLQYWERNTLVLDLQSVPATGEVQLARLEGNPWPVRLAFRMSPSRFQTLEVRGAQRVVYPVSTNGLEPVTVVLPPAAYAPNTEQIRLRWGPSSAF